MHKLLLYMIDIKLNNHVIGMFVRKTNVN